MIPEKEYQTILSSLNSGGLPAIVGYSILPEQAEQIQKALAKRKEHLDNYFQFVIKPRVL